MHIEEIEIDADWSPRRTSPVNTHRNTTPESFSRAQRAALLRLRQQLLDFMVAVTVSSRCECDTSLDKTNPADAGTDAYDRDFALQLLSREHDALYEIDHALRRIDSGTYGICEVSGKPIPHERLQAIPFTRVTVEVQSQIEREKGARRVSESTRSLFAPADCHTNEEEYRNDETLA